MDDTEQSENESDDYHDEPEPDEPVSGMPSEPTDCLPGSVGKIDVLRSRFERNEGLWHDSDMTYERHGQSILENLGSIFPA